MKKIGLSLAVMLLFFTTFPAFATETKFVFVKFTNLSKINQ